MLHIPPNGWQHSFKINPLPATTVSVFFCFELLELFILKLWSMTHEWIDRQDTVPNTDIQREDCIILSPQWYNIYCNLSVLSLSFICKYLLGQWVIYTAVAISPVLCVVQTERDGLKATVESQLTQISDLQLSVAQKTDKLASAEEQVLVLLVLQFGKWTFSLASHW